MFENVFWLIVLFLVSSFILGFMSYGLIDMDKNVEKPKEDSASPAS